MMKKLMMAGFLCLSVLLAIGASPQVHSAGIPEILEPLPGSTLESEDEVFSWTDNGTSVTNWQLNIGTSQGAYDIYDSGQLDKGTLGCYVFGLPIDGSTIHVRLYYKTNWYWAWRDYTYTAVTFSLMPEIIDPPPGSTLLKDLQTFTWTGNGLDVDKYQLYAGSSSGGNDIFDVPMGTSTSVTLNGLPSDGRVVYVTLAYWSNGVRGETQAVYLAQNSSGFISEFQNNHDGWYNTSGVGSWSDGYDSFHGELGMVNDITFLSACYRCMDDNDVDFKDFIYEVKIAAIGPDRDYTGIVFRGDPWPVLSFNFHVWNDGYAFVTGKDGYYQVLKIIDGQLVTLRDWTYSYAINQGWDKNTLKVSAYGPTMDFIINGVHVATIVDHEYSSGNVGVIGLKYEGYFFDMFIDYAVLTSY